MRKIAVFSFIALATSLLWAHPHFPKEVTAELPSGATATIKYTTVPSNESHAVNAAIGSFVTPRGPQITFSADVKSCSTTIAAGAYTIVVIKDGDNAWTLALHPGQVNRRSPADPAKLIKLDSEFRKAENVEHLSVDIVPGHGRLEGKTVLSLRFGTMACEGALE